MHLFLTAKETEVAYLYRQGYSRENISSKLAVSTYTVTKHISNIKKKFKVENNIHLGCKIGDYLNEYFNKKRTFF